MLAPVKTIAYRIITIGFLVCIGCGCDSKNEAETVDENTALTLNSSERLPPQYGGTLNLATQNADTVCSVRALVVDGTSEPVTD